MRLLLLASLIIAITAGKVDYTAEYIDLSMRMEEAMAGTSADTERLHTLVKAVIQADEDRIEVQKLYESYLTELNDADRKVFMEKYLEPIRIEFVEDRVKKVLASYLTKDHINRLRSSIRSSVSSGSTRAEIESAAVAELATDIGKEKAQKAVSLVRKDLSLVARRHPGLVERVEECFHRIL